MNSLNCVNNKRRITIVKETLENFPTELVEDAEKNELGEGGPEEWEQYLIAMVHFYLTDVKYDDLEREIDFLMDYYTINQESEFAVRIEKEC